MNLAELLEAAYPVLLDTTVGTRDAAELERALGALPLGAPIDHSSSRTAAASR